MNFQEKVYISGNLTTCISDHVPQFTVMLIINNLLGKHAPFKEQAKRKD